MAEHVSAGADDLLGEPQVVVEGVELLPGVEEVAGVAEGDLGDRRAGVEHGLDRRAHLLDVVEGVEDPEDVKARACGLVDEGVGDLRRVGRVTDGVAPTKEHLERDVRHRLAQQGEPFPGVLEEEAERHVVRRTAPRLHGQELGRESGDVAGDVEEVARAHPGGQQALVGVAERRVRDGDVVALPELSRERRRGRRAAARRGSPAAEGSPGRWRAAWSSA